MLNREKPSIRDGMQSCETMCNLLGVNYKSAALDQLSYAGKNGPELSVES